MRKLLIWDGDKTLWNGIVADGDHIQLPPGRFEQCKMLSERGVLQAMATHNLSSDLDRILHEFGLTPFFLYNQSGFGTPKSEMVRRILSSYGISKQSDVVYLDDDPFNRADVRDNFPVIMAAHGIFLDDIVAAEFSKVEYTDEDRLRVRRYQSEIQRQQASTGYGGDHQAFLKSCGINLTLRKMRNEDLPRVADLMARANRMAALARSFDIESLIARMGDVTVGFVEDKFGDYGLSAILITCEGFNRPTVDIEALVISCRLQGRGIGSAVLGAVINSYPIDVVVRASWRQTEYNHGVRGLYVWYDFAMEERDSIVSAVLDRKNGSDFPVKRLYLPEWIKVVQQ